MKSQKQEQEARILVVDDEKVIRAILTDYLGEKGFDVVAVENGREALEVLSKEPKDIVLTDLKMPEIDGIALLEEIKRRGIKVMTIIMTGFATVETAIQAMKIGAYDYITKPFKMDEIVEILRRAITQRRLEEENIQLKEVMNLYKVSEAMASTLSLKETLAIILDTTSHEIDADAVVLYQTADGKVRELAKRSTKATGRGRDAFGKLRHSAIAKHFKTSPFLLLDKKSCMSFFERLPKHEGFHSFLCVPLKVRDRLTGILCAYSCRPDHRFVEGHSRILSILASKAAMAIENAQLYERLQGVFQETIQGLVTALEAKDPYTSGHTKRVTKYAVLIAKGMGLSPEEIEQISRAGLLHDIGKIGIRLEALNKKGKLSRDEHERFKDHASYSKQILEPILFLKDIVPIVLCHHERYDGKGYPKGKKGEKIPLGARVLAVADSYDAMTADRPYRKAFSVKKAIGELRAHTGTQFDPKVVEAFIKELKERKK